MATFAFIDNGNVVNRIEADSLDTARSLTDLTVVACDGTSRIGGTWDGKTFYPIPEKDGPSLLKKE